MHNCKKSFAFLFVVTLFIALTACSSVRPFPEEAFPYQGGPADEGAAARGPVTVNLYIQATRSMAGLLTADGSNFPDALYSALRTPREWGTGNYLLNVFRFDVQNQEPITYANEFAYPLDYPAQVLGFRDAHNHVDGIFDVDFYCFGWYLRQAGRRAPGSFGAMQAQLWYYPHHFISSTIQEINSLRGGEREISVVVTNFIGNPNEPSNIYAQMTAYLQNPDKAIATLAFANGGTPFYIFVLGSTVEVAEYATRLRSNLANMSPLFGFYTRGSSVAGKQGNSNVAVAETFAGTRLAFDEDIHRDEQFFMADAIYYTVWNRLIDDNQARFSLELDLDLLNIPHNMIQLSYSTRLMVLNDTGHMAAVPEAVRYININIPAHPTAGSLPLEALVDMSVFEHVTRSRPVKAVLVADIDARLVPARLPEAVGEAPFPNELFVSIVNQFYTDINVADYTGTAMQFYVHFIYR